MAMASSTALTLALVVLAATTFAAHAGGESSAAVGASSDPAVSVAQAGAFTAGSSSESSQGPAATAAAAVADGADVAAARSFSVYPQSDGTDYGYGGRAPFQGGGSTEGTALASPVVVDDATSTGVAAGASGEQPAGGSSSVHTVLVSVVGAVIVMTALFCCIAFCCCKELCGCVFGDTLSSGDYDMANLAEAGAAGAVLDHVTKY